MPERDHLQCDPTSIQSKNGRGGVNLIYGKAVELESVTPSKVKYNMFHNIIQFKPYFEFERKH